MRLLHLLYYICTHAEYIFTIKKVLRWNKARQRQRQQHVVVMRRVVVVVVRASSACLSCHRRSCVVGALVPSPSPSLCRRVPLVPLSSFAPCFCSGSCCRSCVMGVSLSFACRWAVSIVVVVRSSCIGGRGCHGQVLSGSFLMRGLQQRLTFFLFILICANYQITVIILNTNIIFEDFLKIPPRMSDNISKSPRPLNIKNFSWPSLITGIPRSRGVSGGEQGALVKSGCRGGEKR
jgi:hypothetical protein